ncbi:hypothetical protein NUW54_g11121 [Trametes sanguinea]|uniref:Uncharacterized protein n=1 Tax=Trametes sanguinea TaxID=158606 RepID=A0ACC1NKX3_9APHY|nr:hypothetical protein NUW54_g11121 [Trametes sanguinea]
MHRLPVNSVGWEVQGYIELLQRCAAEPARCQWSEVPQDIGADSLRSRFSDRLFAGKQVFCSPTIIASSWDNKDNTSTSYPLSPWKTRPLMEERATLSAATKASRERVALVHPMITVSLCSTGPGPQRNMMAQQRGHHLLEIPPFPGHTQGYASAIGEKLRSFGATSRPTGCSVRVSRKNIEYEKAVAGFPDEYLSIQAVQGAREACSAYESECLQRGIAFSITLEFTVTYDSLADFDRENGISHSSWTWEHIERRWGPGRRRTRGQHSGKSWNEMSGMAGE